MQFLRFCYSCQFVSQLLIHSQYLLCDNGWVSFKCFSPQGAQCYCLCRGPWSDTAGGRGLLYLLPAAAPLVTSAGVRTSGDAFFQLWVPAQPGHLPTALPRWTLHIPLVTNAPTPAAYSPTSYSLPAPWRVLLSCLVNLGKPTNLSGTQWTATIPSPTRSEAEPWGGSQGFAFPWHSPSNLGHLLLFSLQLIVTILSLLNSSLE